MYVISTNAGLTPSDGKYSKNKKGDNYYCHYLIFSERISP